MPGIPQSGEAIFKNGLNEHVSGIINQESGHVLILDLARVLDLGGSA
jgi:chemotaxis signal transduction protein